MDELYICSHCGKSVPLNKISGIQRKLRVHTKPTCYSCLKRHSKFMERYGLSIENYEKKFIEQDGKCLICKRHQSILIKRLRVDHNHSTGLIRGLLCDNCNTMIGLAHENKEHFMQAIKYLDGEI